AGLHICCHTCGGHHHQKESHHTICFCGLRDLFAVLQLTFQYARTYYSAGWADLLYATTYYRPGCASCFDPVIVGRACATSAQLPALRKVRSPTIFARKSSSPKKCSIATSIT